MTADSGADYRSALAFLFPRTTTIKLGLDTTRALLAALGDPHRHCPVLHIAGTNGKGSVAAFCAAALEAAGLRTALYTSPHLVSFRERIRVDGAPISERAVAAWTELLRPLAVEREASFFEITTAMAFADFAARGAEIAVVEVGLGGRLDSTNVVEPAVTVITRIATEHVEWLGETLEQIGAEKAGIAKPGVPCIVAEPEPALAGYLARRVEAAGGLPVLLPAGEEWRGPVGLAGAYQRRNAMTAAAALRALPPRWRPAETAIARGIAAAELAGRYDRRGRWLFDVAHNPDGVKALAGELRREPPPGPLHVVAAVLRDKDWRGMLTTLDPLVACGVLTLAPSAGDRAWEMAEVARWAADTGGRWAVEPRLEQALERAQRGAGTVLVTGSFHTVGDAMAHLGLAPVQASRDRTDGLD